MVYLTKDLLKKGETEYSIRNKVLKGKLYSVERGVYSDEPNPLIDEVYLSKVYPNAIITGISAFSIYDLTDYIPETTYLATEQHSFPIRQNDIVQSYQDPSFFNVGRTTMKSEDGEINIYDLERLLIELIRLKEKYPRELYYEVLNNFRNIKHKLDYYKLNSYLKSFKNGDSLLFKIKELI